MNEWLLVLKHTLFIHILDFVRILRSSKIFQLIIIIFLKHNHYFTFNFSLILYETRWLKTFSITSLLGYACTDNNWCNFCPSDVNYFLFWHISSSHTQAQETQQLYTQYCLPLNYRVTHWTESLAEILAFSLDDLKAFSADACNADPALFVSSKVSNG